MICDELSFRVTVTHVYMSIGTLFDPKIIISYVPIHLKFDINNNNSHAHKKFLKVLHMVMFCHL